jgi:hypothetical protein
MLPTIAGVIGVCHHTQIFSVELGSHELFEILLISASYMARLQA